MVSYTKIERLTYFGLIKACEIKFTYMKEWLYVYETMVVEHS